MKDSESITVKIIKHFYNNEPTHWSVEVDDIYGGLTGIATGPTFHGVWDEAYGFITGRDEPIIGESDDWVDFDANAKKAE